MSDITTSASEQIAASPERVWKAITTSAEIKQWFFGVDTETDWKVGSRLVHRGEYQGRPYQDSGEIVEIDPPRLLIHTHWSPMSGLPDRPENYQRVTWTLDGSDGATTLTVAEDNLPSEEAKAISDRSWPQALQNLRELLEG